MSLETSLYAALAAVCPRVFPDVADTSTVRPYVTYQQVGGDVINPLSNGSPGRRNASVQINVWANTRLQANSLSLQIEDAMRAATAFIAQPQSASFSDYDYDMSVYGSQQDFSVWY